jgi:hypothetical protein
VLVHRALRSRRWIDEDTGELQVVAFFLREHEDPLDGGISVSESTQAAISALSKCFGYATLRVFLVRLARYPDGTSIGANVVCDPLPTDDMHALIIGAPPWAPLDSVDFKRQQLFADALIRSAVTEVHRGRFQHGKLIDK